MELPQMLVNLLESICVGVCLSFAGASFNKNKFKFLLLGLFAFLYVTIAFYFMPSYNGSKAEPYISLFFIIMLYMLFFKQNAFNSAFYSLFGFFIVLIFELLTLVVFSIFNIDFEFLLSSLWHQVWFGVLRLIFVLVLAQFNFFRNLIKKFSNLIPYLIAVIANVFVFFQILRILTDWVMNGKSVSYSYVYILFFAMIIINALLIKIVLGTQKENNQIKSFNEYEKMIIPLINNSRSIEHDFKNHLLTLKSMVKNTSAEFDDYMNQINDELNVNSVYKLCNNPVMGALLQEKSNYANEHQIDFEIEVFEKSELTQSVKPYHLITVLSNLIDNAFEEVQKCTEDKKHVSLEYTQNENIQMSIKNTLSKSSDVNVDNLHQSKRYSTKGKSRGYGLKNVKKIIKKYNGDLKIYHQDDSIEIKVELNP